MSDSMKFSRIAKPTSLGTYCWTCLTPDHREGFVQFDAGATGDGNGCIIGYGHVTLCAGCVYELARVVGCKDPEQARILHGQLEEMSVANETLEALLAEEKENKVVPLADVIDLVEERAKRRGPRPKVVA